MWSEIKKNGIVAYATNARGKSMHTIPEGTASLAVTRLINMTQWIYDEFMRDATKHPAILQSENPGETEAFVTRNTSRVVSYVNLIYVLEKILAELYRETITKLQIIDPSIVSNGGELKLREVDVVDCFTFRNKVSAHTVYGSPRSEDNTAMEFHSLVALLSSSYNGDGNADSFALGAPSVRLAGEDPSIEIPLISLKELHPKMLQHFEGWTRMLIEPCLVARQKLPIIVGDTEYKAG